MKLYCCVLLPFYISFVRLITTVIVSDTSQRLSWQIVSGLQTSELGCEASNVAFQRQPSVSRLSLARSALVDVSHGNYLFSYCLVLSIGRVGCHGTGHGPGSASLNQIYTATCSYSLTSPSNSNFMALQYLWYLFYFNSKSISNYLHHLLPLLPWPRSSSHHLFP